MKRYIANYTHALTDEGPRLYVNHVITLDDSDCLLSLEPFESELPNTCYIDRPVTILNAARRDAPVTLGTRVTLQTD